MAHQLTLERLVQYNAGEPGITIDTTLEPSDNGVSFPAKVDTGASYLF